MTRFRNIIYFTLTLSFVLSFTNCVSIVTASLQRKSIKEVEVFSTKLPSKEYDEIKYIQVEGSIFATPEKMLKTLSEKAKKEDADALINVQFAYGPCLPYIWGIAIKYKTS